MGRISNIFSRVRNTLADSSVTPRWSDDTLILLFNAGYLEMCQYARNIKASVDIEAAEGQAVYSIPTDSHLITQIKYNNVPLKLISSLEINRLYSTYGETTGTPTMAVYDETTFGTFRLYPIPIETGYINLFYIKIPDEITSVDDDTILEFPSTYDSILYYYIVGNALFQDMDTQNRTVGKEFLVEYSTRLESMKKDMSMGMLTNGEPFTTFYKTGFER